MTHAPATPGSALTTALGDIKLAHSVFAMPFAILGAALAFEPDPGAARVAVVLALVVVCMVFARTWAMLVNRLADARFDADNPRTAGRAVAAGRLSVRQGWLVALGSALLFCATAALFWPLTGNAWPAILCVPVLGFIALYSYTKRFTALCHVFLGAALAISPLAAGIAVRPESLADVPALWFIAGFVLLWVLLHAAAYVLLIAAAFNEPRFGIVFLASVAAVGLLLMNEHWLLARRGRAGIPMVFFTYNGIASVVLGLAGLLDVALGA
jgi:4-hydroxybenzoate polyprenyltransferase